VAVEPRASVAAVARTVRDRDLGDVVAADGGLAVRSVTDRDLAVRSVAEGAGPERTTVAGACSDAEVVTVSPDDGLDHVAELMREHAVRRVPAVEDGRPAGIVSLGDLAVARDPGSALGDISAARSDV
jgi:CBS domain-containing protein